MQRTMMCVVAAALSACAVDGRSATAVQEVAGPGGVMVTVRDVGQLAVSWTADPAAASYSVFQSAAGGAFALVASVFDSSGGPPSTSWIADGLADGVRYCFALQSVYRDGTTSELGAAACGTASSTTPRRTHTYKLSPLSGTNVGAGQFQVLAGQLSGNWTPVHDGDLLGVQLAVQAGERFESITASIYGNTAYTITMSARAQDDAFHGSARLGSEQTSTAQNTTQTLTVFPLANDNSGNNEQVTTSQRSYSLQFCAHRVGSSDGGQLFVGPITLTTSTPTPI